MDPVSADFRARRQRSSATAADRPRRFINRCDGASAWWHCALQRGELDAETGTGFKRDLALIDLCGVGLDLVEATPKSTPRLLEIVVGLEPHPELFRRAEVARQTQRRVGGDRTLGVDDLVDSTRRYAHRPSDAVLAEPHGDQEFLEQDLSRMNVG